MGLATAYKVADVNCVHVFGLKTAFGGGRSTGFALMYDNLAAAKKFEPKHRLKRVGIAPPTKTGRRNRKDLRHRQAKLRGKPRARPPLRRERAVAFFPIRSARPP